MSRSTPTSSSECLVTRREKSSAVEISRTVSASVSMGRERKRLDQYQDAPVERTVEAPSISTNGPGAAFIAARATLPTTRVLPLAARVIMVSCRVIDFEAGLISRCSWLAASPRRPESGSRSAGAILGPRDFARWALTPAVSRHDRDSFID